MASPNLNSQQQSTFAIAGAIAFVGISILASSLFSVKETQTVFLVQFGEVVRTVESPGLQARIPLIQDIISFDKRLMQVDSPAREVISLDQKRLIVDAYAKYKITNPSMFYKTLRTTKSADTKITSILDSSLRQVVASNPFVALLSQERMEMMTEVQNILSKQTKDFGVEIVDVRIVRADLPVENSNAIFARMKTEREKEAMQLRAEGFEESEIVKANADREVRQLYANANMNSKMIKGKAEAKASSIYSDAYSKDVKFFEFYKSMDAYKTSLKANNTRIVMSSDDEFLKQLNNSGK